MNKIKIIATIGKFTSDIDMLEKLIKNGVDAFRINTNYFSLDFCKEIIEKINVLNYKLNTYVAIILDIKGSTLKVGKMQDGQSFFRKDDKIRIFKGKLLGDYTKFSIDSNEFIENIPLNSKLIVGETELKILNKNEDNLLCQVVKDGYISENDTINIPNVKLFSKFLNDQDKEIIKFAIKNNVDFLCLSKIYSSEDVLEVSDLLINEGNDHIQIISKIENIFAVDDMDNIIKISDAIIIDREGLNNEIALEKIPGIQKKIINKCRNKQSVSIVTTDLLSTEQDYNYPIRAEVSDIANAILDGTDCIMLTCETAIGNTPLQTLQMLEKIINTVEYDINYMENLNFQPFTDLTDTLAYSVSNCALSLQAKAIITPTKSGVTAKKISYFRTICPIIAPTPSYETAKSLALHFGVVPILIEDLKTLDAIIEKSKKIAQEKIELKHSDYIIITGGYPFEVNKHTNFMKIEEI